MYRMSYVLMCLCLMCKHNITCLVDTWLWFYRELINCYTFYEWKHIWLQIYCPNLTLHQWRAQRECSTLNCMSNYSGDICVNWHCQQLWFWEWVHKSTYSLIITVDHFSVRKHKQSLSGAVFVILFCPSVPLNKDERTIWQTCLLTFIWTITGVSFA